MDAATSNDRILAAIWVSFLPRNAELTRNALKLASETLELVDEIEVQASVLVHEGFRPLDALHLAFAVQAKVEYFCTCDDRLTKKFKRLKNLAFRNNRCTRCSGKFKC